MNDQNDVPMIEEYKHESAMVHETKKSKYAMIAAIFANIVTIIALIVLLLVVLLASLLDMAVSKGSGIQFEATLGATCLWFIASEGLSILENCASMGVPVPQILLKLLEIMKQKGDAPEEQPAEDKTDE